MSREVVIEEETLPFVPEIFDDSYAAQVRFARPLAGFIFAAKQQAHLLEILLGLVEQAVEAHRGEAMRIGSVRTEAKRDIESRFAHAAIALVEIGCERNSIFP